MISLNKSRLRPGIRIVLWFGFAAATACSSLPAGISLPSNSSNAAPPATAGPAGASASPGAGQESEPFTPTFTAISDFAQVTGTPANSCVPSKGEISAGIVTQVIDGDTIEIRDAQKNALFKVQYLGIRVPADNPKSPEFFGNQATVKNRQLVAGKTVILVKDVSDTDSSGALLRYVFVENLFVNYELVREGYAFAKSAPPDVACGEVFSSAEAAVKARRMGVWSITPTPPKGVKATSTPEGNAARTSSPSPVPTEKGVCDCRGPKLSCSNFDSQSAAQACYAYCKGKGWGDIFGLDADHDGQACPALP